MKLFLVISMMLFSSVSFAVATVNDAKNFVNQEISASIDFLNSSFTKLGIASCNAIRITRPDDTVELLNATVWSGGVSSTADLTIRLVYSRSPTKTGMAKRVDLYVNDGTGETFGAQVEFTCDMKKGFLVQTGRDNGTTASADLLEAYWDNTNGNIVEFMLVGPVDGNIFCKRDSAQGQAFTAVTTLPAVKNSLVNLFGLDKTLWPASWSNDGSPLIFE